MSDNGIKHVAYDIVQVRIPLPYALNHVNCYLLRGAEGWTMLDSGLNTPPAQSQWKTAFNQLDITPDDITQIVLTHMHPDHFGMAGYWQARVDSPMPVYLPDGEKRQADMFYGMDDLIAYHNWLLKCGMHQHIVDDVSRGFKETRNLTQPFPLQQDYITAENTIRMGERDFRMIHAPGHSDGQIIFYNPDDKLLLCGDHVLMKITPNIGLWPQTNGNPLGSFMDSLHVLADLEVQQALPGHRWIIDDWRGRIEELITHHQHRLDVTMSAFEAGHETVYDIATHVFPIDRYTPHEWRFAMAETLAHLDLLERQGKVTHIDDDVWRYRLS